MSKQRKKKGVSLSAKKARMGWVFVAPFVLGFFLFYLVMIVQSISFSFMNVTTSPEGGFKTKFCGIDNYVYMLRTIGYFTEQTYASVQRMLTNLLPLLLFSLFVAILLNRKMKGRTIFRAIFFIPVILATGIIAKSDAANNLQGMFNSFDMGAAESAVEEVSSAFSVDGIMYFVEQIFVDVPGSDWILTFVENAAQNVYGIINDSGVQILIFLSGLQSISPSLYEAASIEGCSAWESFWKITIPMISPMILVNIIYTMVDSFTKYNNDAMRIVQEQLVAGNYGNAAAAGWFYFVIIAVLVLIIVGIASRFVFYQNRD